jgi:hypothetical protein
VVIRGPIEAVDNVPYWLLDEFCPAVREAMGQMIGCGVLTESLLPLAFWRCRPSDLGCADGYYMDTNYIRSANCH